MSEQQRVSRTRTGHEQDAVAQQGQGAQSTSSSDEGFDALLDEIDTLLESNADDYVRSFVQKGGQ